MGEILERPRPAVIRPFDSERLSTGFRRQTEIVHLHRYILAQHLCRGRAVLDFVTGESYPTFLLGWVVGTVTSGADAVDHANRNCRGENLFCPPGVAGCVLFEDSHYQIVAAS